jgi:hypothetical protein
MQYCFQEDFKVSQFLFLGMKKEDFPRQNISSQIKEMGFQPSNFGIQVSSAKKTIP